MNELNDYKIPFKGLSQGLHSFQFHITEKFFESMRSVDVYPTHIEVRLEMDIHPGLITLRFSGIGYIIVLCDICLDEFNLPIQFEHQVVVRVSEGESEDDDLIFLNPNESHLDISQIIYDDIMLNIPLRKVHPENEDGSSGCNPEQLKYLEKLSKKNSADHRWDALKDLKFDD